MTKRFVFSDEIDINTDLETMEQPQKDFIKEVLDSVHIYSLSYLQAKEALDLAGSMLLHKVITRRN